MKDFTGKPKPATPHKGGGPSGPPSGGPQIIGVHPGGSGSSVYDPRTRTWTPVSGPLNLGNNLTGHPNGSITWAPPGGLGDDDDD